MIKKIGVRMKAIFKYYAGDKRINDFMRCADLFREGEGVAEECIVKFDLKKGVRI